MKAGTRLLTRHRARSRELDALRRVRTPPGVTFSEDRYVGQQLPLSFAPYRLQAADRWWRENGSAEEPARKPES